MSRSKETARSKRTITSKKSKKAPKAPGAATGVKHAQRPLAPGHRGAPARSASFSAPRTFFCRSAPSSAWCVRCRVAQKEGLRFQSSAILAGAGGRRESYVGVASRRYQPRVHPQRPRDDPAKGHPPRPLPPW
ncbi:hypothetical protein TcBrA4_0079950 [Trypanosoma cruzi]|nr:hypothetical protein TcBrA4_0079950 [Trypanosoma cruzi]